MKKIILIAFMLVVKLNYSQDSECSTVSLSSYKIDSQSEIHDSTKQLFTISSTACIDVFFHLVRDDNGVGGFDENDLPNIIKRLNLRYNKHGIFLKSSGYDEIFDSDLTHLANPTEELDLFTKNVVQNAINFYIVDSSWAGGKAENAPSHKLYVPKNNIYISNSEHEVGHCFGLEHTHETLYGIENIDGSNCTSAGDKICDTPADPNLLNKVNIYCQYDGSDNDPNNGVIYQPDVNNIMSYSKKSCRVRFTEQQGLAMLDSIQTVTLLQNTISTSCQLPYIIGSNTICGNVSKTYTFNYAINYTNAVDSWSVSSNLIILNQTATAITVQGGPGAVGATTITATINGYDVIKSITLDNLPNISNYQIQGVGTTVGVYSFDNVHVNTSSNATQYEWTIVDDYNSCNGIYDGPVFPSYNNSTQVITTSASIGIKWGSCTGTFRVRCKAMSSCGFKYYNDKEVTVENEPCSTSLRLSPNPATDYVNARIAIPAPCDDVLRSSSLDGKLTYTVYNSSGNVIYKKKKAKHIEKISVKNLEKGIYFIEVLLPNNQRHIKSLIKD